MTTHEFVEKWRHEIGGIVLDAVTTQARGAELSLFCRTILRKIDNILVRMHEDAKGGCDATTSRTRK